MSAATAPAPQSPANSQEAIPPQDEARWAPVLHLPCELTVEIPMQVLRLAELSKLASGAVLRSRWRVSRDVPLRINGSLIGWAELEGSGNHLAVRLTELE